MHQKERKNKRKMLKFQSQSINLQILIEILFLSTFLLFGGYYEFVSAILAVAAVIVSLHCNSRGECKIKVDNYFLFASLLAFFYVVSSFYAIDSGMAWTGFAKKCYPFLFAVLISKMEIDQRKKLLKKLPQFACALTVLSGVGIFIPAFRSHIWMAGRFAGTFQNANAYALFLLLAILTKLESWKKKEIVLNIVELVILLLGLYLTGSRFTWILTMILFFIIAFWDGKQRKGYVVLVGVLFAVTAGAATVFRNTEAIGRLFTTNRSTLYGRMLYWQDAVQLIFKHPFGMGYLGYYYAQTQIQTGEYTVRYVHNDWLQWVLDVGCVPALILLLCILYALVEKKRCFLEKMLLAVILVHGCMEYDLEYSTITILLVLILSCEEETIGNGRKWNINFKIENTILLIIGGICLYFSVPLILYASGNTMAAVSWYPIYTDAQIANLSIEENPQKADRLANQIIKQNKTVALAYDTKAIVAYLNSDWNRMFYYKKEAIRKNKFAVSEYTQAIELLNAMEKETGESGIVQMRIKEVKSMAQKNETSVSTLGKMIDDQVELDLNEN